LLEGSQATPARPSGKNNVKVITLWWLGDRQRNFEFHIILSII
jgi:hypothetical protein